MAIWELISKFLVDTEYANNIKFTQTAWDRALQLEKDIQAAKQKEWDALVESADNLIDEKDRQIKLLEADMASLIKAGNEMRKNLGIWTGQIESALYRWDEVVKQTTAIGAVQLLRDAEEARKLRARVSNFETDLTYGVFPGGRSYEEWVAAGRPYEAGKANG